MISKPKTRLVAASFTRAPDECAEALFLEIARNAAQHLGEIRPGPAAGVQHINVLRCQPVRDPEVVLQRPVHPRDHVADDLVRGVPDPELLAEVRIEGSEERLVEVRNRLPFPETGEERRPVHTVERGGSPIEHFDETEGFQTPGIGELLKERPEHGSPQMPDCGVPIEVLFLWARPCPQHPGREDPVKERLHQR